MSTTNRRAALIKTIQTGRRELTRRGVLDEVSYRRLIASAAGRPGAAEKVSCTELDLAGLERALKALRGMGFAPRAKAGDRRQDTRREARKVRALWLFLGTLGVVKTPTEAALATYAKRIAYVDDLHWAHGDAMLRLIETLKKWAMRFLPAAVQQLRAEAVERARREPLPKHQAIALAHAVDRLNSGEGFDIHWAAWESLMTALGRPIPGDIAQELRQ
ncbi:regulatory protein GemA [uncultured Pseudacidovorax sp.]|uniref:regulatory protein GemA n=1 Tax=uncultured Pseudacidovorax sp. TaxID=679313 RepID=UPI0025E33C04|nr:regulatory protein GemA [uncultured Pseudacidovorax sp.]